MLSTAIHQYDYDLRGGYGKFTEVTLHIFNVIRDNFNFSIKSIFY